MKIKRMLRRAAFAALATLALATSAQAQQRGAAQSGPDPRTLTQQQIEGVQVPSALYRLAAVYKQTGDMQRLVWSLQRLNALLPNTGELKLALASVYAQEGDTSKTYSVLVGMQRQGFGYDL